ncbi:GIN domain-containing protein [Pedobacter sp.]|uniref:GIN domain-containing protein n=1 Tax=Pedobacter sp. TaxID=1411316 RepID=UPI003D7FC8AF
MKTTIKNLIAAGIAATVLLGTTIAAKADVAPAKSTVLSSIKNISNIAISGNVELILIQGAEESVKVYNDYYANNAMVQHKDGQLRVSSFGKEKLTVVVHVKNLSAISAADQSTIKTYGKFNLLHLSISLEDQAKADINANTVSVATDIKGEARLNLSGNTEAHYAHSAADKGCRFAEVTVKDDKTVLEFIEFAINCKKD